MYTKNTPPSSPRSSRSANTPLAVALGVAWQCKLPVAGPTAIALVDPQTALPTLLNCCARSDRACIQARPGSRSRRRGDHHPVPCQTHSSHRHHSHTSPTSHTSHQTGKAGMAVVALLPSIPPMRQKNSANGPPSLNYTTLECKICSLERHHRCALVLLNKTVPVGTLHPFHRLVKQNVSALQSRI